MNTTVSEDSAGRDLRGSGGEGGREGGEGGREGERNFIGCHRQH